jgi:hypothetical protein
LGIWLNENVMKIVSLAFSGSPTIPRKQQQKTVRFGARRMKIASNVIKAPEATSSKCLFINILEE